MLIRVYADRIVRSKIPGPRLEEIISEKSAPTAEEARRIARAVTAVNIRTGDGIARIENLFDYINLDGEIIKLDKINPDKRLKKFNVDECYITLQMNSALKMELKSKLSDLHISMNSFFNSAAIKFCSAPLFERLFGRDFQNEGIEVLMEYVTKLCEIIKKNAGKSSPRRESLSKSDKEELHKKLPGLQKIKHEIFEIREKLGLLTKEEVIREKARYSVNAAETGGNAALLKDDTKSH